MENRIYKIIVRSIMTLVLFTTFSCKDFTEVKPISEFDLSQTFADIPSATTAVIGAYSNLIGDRGYGSRISMYWTIDTDESMTTGNVDGTRRSIARYQYSLTNVEITNPFNYLYAGIEKANLCIERIPQMPLYTKGTASEQAQLKRLHGEVLVLRAQYYHELIRNFGDVPAPMEPSYKLTDLFVPQADRDATYDKLIADLAVAADLLPWRTEVGSYSERITKGAAKALRARIALYRGGYSLRQSGKMERSANYLDYYKIAKEECEQLMAKRDQHTLHPSFSDFWIQHCDVSGSKNPSGEILFEVAAGGGNGTTDSRIGDLNGTAVDGNSRYTRGTGSLVIPATYFYAFDSVDTRRDVTIATYSIVSDNFKRATTGTTMTVGKYRIDWRSPVLGGVPGSNPINKGYNWVLIRFSDVLLMFAEAENELNGPTPAAIAAFEEVRKRAFAGNIALIGTTPTAKAAFFNAIVNERLLEFGNEGIRKYDLLRWNLFTTKLAELRANLVKLRDRVAPYNNVPQYIYYKNGGTTPFSTGTVNGEGIVYYTAWSPNGGSSPFYKPTQVPTSTGSAPPTGAVNNWVRVNWAQQLVGNSYADGKPIDQAIAGFFEPGKSELFPYTNPILISYQGKLKQNPGY